MPEIHVHEIQFALSVSIYTKLAEFAHRNRNRNRRWTWILLNYATCPSSVWPHTHCCCWCFAFSNWLHNFIFVVVVVIFTSTKSGEYIVSTSAWLPLDGFAYWIWWWNNWNSPRNKSQMNSKKNRKKAWRIEIYWRIGVEDDDKMFDSSSFGSFVSFALANKLTLSYSMPGGTGGEYVLQIA